jgi:RNA polymerase sigma factor (sigma-70 family)
MVTPQPHPLARLVQQIASAAASVSDAQLLERFAARRDGDAFALLVRRHGPMVLGVCRRVLQDWHAAEDAFQATFLVLARRAGSLRRPQAVGAWLHGVAHRTALKIRTAAARRRLCERDACQYRPEAQHPLDPTWLDIRGVLDDAIDCLPGRYREPFILCCLEGRTVSQTANQLGWPRGTVATRLARAKVRLRRLLARHEAALPGALFAVAFEANTAAAAVPVAVARSTASAALEFMDDAATAAGSVPAGVAATAREVLRNMLVTRIRMTVTGLIALALLGGGLSTLFSWTTAAAQTAQPPVMATKGESAKKEDAADKTKEIELPTAPIPTQAVAQIDKDDKLVVRQTDVFYQPVTMQGGNGQPVTTYERIAQKKWTTFELKEVRVYDTQGKIVDSKMVRKMLTKETLVLVTTNLDPLHMRLIKDGTLVLELPAPMPPPAVGAPPGIIIPPMAPPGAIPPAPIKR